MASEQISRVLEAESQAEQIEKSTRQKVEQILSVAGETGNTDFNKVMEQTDEEVKILFESFEERDDAFHSQEQKKAEEKARALRAFVEPRMDEACTALVDLVCGKG